MRRDEEPASFSYFIRPAVPGSNDNQRFLHKRCDLARRKNRSLLILPGGLRRCRFQETERQEHQDREATSLSGVHGYDCVTPDFGAQT